METKRTHEFMSDDWLRAVRAVFEDRAAKVASSAGPEPFTVQERYTGDDQGTATTGWHCTFADGQVVDFGRGESPNPDMASTSPRDVARRLASTILGDDADAIAAYAADHTAHVHRSITCDAGRVQGLAAALADAHDAIASFTAREAAEPAMERRPR